MGLEAGSAGRRQAPRRDDPLTDTPDLSPRRREDTPWAVHGIIPPDKIAEARRRYEETNEHNEDIAAFLGISPSTLKSRRRQWGWRPRLTHWFKPQTPASEATAAEQAVYQAILNNALAEAERIRRTVECELAGNRAHRRETSAGQHAPQEVERSARVLASLTRTLQEVIRLGEPNEAPSDRAMLMTEPPTIPTNSLRELV